jgi:hypothetical protein
MVAMSNEFRMSGAARGFDETCTYCLHMRCWGSSRQHHERRHGLAISLWVQRASLLCNMLVCIVHDSVLFVKYESIPRTHTYLLTKLLKSYGQKTLLRLCKNRQAYSISASRYRIRQSRYHRRKGPSSTISANHSSPNPMILI